MMTYDRLAKPGSVRTFISDLPLPTMANLRRHIIIMTGICFVVSWLISCRNPHSPVNFFISSQLQQLHDEALEAGNSFIAAESPYTYMVPDSTPDITFVIISSLRPRAYLYSLLATLLPSSLPVGIINSQTEPRAHTQLDVLRQAKAKFPNLANIYDLYDHINATKSASNMSPEAKVQEWIGRQFAPYIAALEFCISQASPQCVVFEDDALPSRDFVAQLRSLIANIPVRSRHHLMKLYRGTDLDGFQVQYPVLLTELLIPALLGAQVIFAAIFYIFWKRHTSNDGRILYGRRRGSRNPTKLALVFATIFANSIMFALMFSRQAFVELFAPRAAGPLKPIPLDMEAANIAIVYPLNASIALQSQFRNRLDQRYPPLQPIDIELYGWAKANDWGLFVSNRAIVQHIGAYSTNPELLTTPNYLRFDSTFSL